MIVLTDCHAMLSIVKYVTEPEMLIQFVKKQREGNKIVYYGRKMNRRDIEKLETPWLTANDMNKQWRNKKFRGKPFGIWVQVVNYLNNLINNLPTNTFETIVIININRSRWLQRKRNEHEKENVPENREKRNVPEKNIQRPKKQRLPFHDVYQDVLSNSPSTWVSKRFTTK